MSDESLGPMTDHEYDGIRELDNDLPIWWLVIFGATIIFAFVYWMHYEIAGGPTSSQELAEAMKAIEAVKKTGPSFSEDKLLALFTPESARQGAGVFEAKCASCHGAAAQGLIGPNLTDRHWIHGNGSRTAIMEVVARGVLDKGMPAWSEMISESELIAVSSFVHSVKGTNAAGGKPAQGTEYP